MVSEFSLSSSTRVGFPTSPPGATLSTPQYQEQWMRLVLWPDIPALLSVAQLAAVLSIPLGAVLPIPHLPAYILGVYNWRGEILWLVDLGQLLGFAAGRRSLPNYNALVLQQGQSIQAGGTTGLTSSKKLGLIVDRVEDVIWLEPTAIQAPLPTTTPNIVPFLRGHWLPPEGEIHQVLDGDGIFAAMPQTRMSL